MQCKYIMIKGEYSHYILKMCHTDFITESNNSPR